MTSGPRNPADRDSRPRRRSNAAQSIVHVGEAGQLPRDRFGEVPQLERACRRVCDPIQPLFAAPFDEQPRLTDAPPTPEHHEGPVS